MFYKYPDGGYQSSGSVKIGGIFNILANNVFTFCHINFELSDLQLKLFHCLNVTVILPHSIQ